MIAARHRRFRGGMAIRALCVALSMALYVTAPPAHAQAAAQEEAVRQYDIPAGPLPGALSAWGAQSGQQLVFPPELVAGKTSHAVSGRYTAGEALRRLLQGSGLEAQDAGGLTFTLRQAPEPGAEPQTGKPDTQAPEQSTEHEIQELASVTVTGTRIRGGETSSPSITIGAEQIQAEGFTDLGEVIRSVPQNFTGGQNPGVLSLNIAAAGHANNNLTGGSSLNLRGLGPDATLTLLNGRRMAYGGFTQAVDIAAIPVEAVERIEIVADGASAIYGSDAVGGVGNVILKRDYQGATISALYGTATDGGLATREYAVTAGAAWATGGLIATYKYAAIDPIYATDRSYTDLLTPPTTIYPGIDLQSGLISAHHALGDIAELRVDAFRTERDQKYSMLAPNGMFNRATPDNTTTLVSPSVEFFLPNDWAMSIGATWSKNEHVQVQAWQNITTWDSTVWIDECYCNEGRLYEIGAEGPMFRLPGGEARLAVGAGYRENEFLHYNYLADTSLTTGDESARFGYAEISLPLVGEESNIAGVRRLAFTAAARMEDYDSFGSVTTPKLGLIYGPSADLTLKASWGRSFKAPTLFQRHYAPTAYLYYPAGFGGTDYPDGATVIFLDGGNSDLDPERARTWTASLAVHPEAVPSLQAELAWFDIDYTDRVVQPIANASEALSNPIFADFISHWPSSDEADAAVSGADRFVNTIGVPFDPGRVAAIMYGQYRNVARQRVRGLDLTGSYWRDLATGRLTLRGSATWLDSSQQTTRSQSAMDLAGTLHNPPAITGRVGAVWTQGGFTGSAFGNYKGGVENAAVAEKTGSFTTVDMTLRYATERQGGLASGLEFALSAQNVLDRAPPLYTPARPLYVPPYDATNYSAIGRFVSISVAKRW